MVCMKLASMAAFMADRLPIFYWDTPGRPDEDFLMTSDDLDEVAAMVARRKDKQP